MFQSNGLKIFAFAFALLLSLAAFSSATFSRDLERREVERGHRGSGMGIGTGIGIGIGIGVGNELMRQQAEPPPGGLRTRRKDAKNPCFTDIKNTPGLIRCRTKNGGTSCGTSPNRCILYRNGGSEGKTEGLYTPPQSDYSCQCE